MFVPNEFLTCSCSSETGPRDNDDVCSERHHGDVTVDHLSNQRQ